MVVGRQAGQLGRHPQNSEEVMLQGTVCMEGPQPGGSVTPRRLSEEEV